MKYLYLLLFLLVSVCSYSQIKKDTIEAKKYLEKADSLFAIASYDSSNDLYLKAAGLYKKNSLWKPYIRSFARSAEVNARQGKFEEAQEKCQLALSLCLAKSLSKTITEAPIRNTNGFIYLNKGQNDLALENYKQALSIYNSSKVKNKTELASCYNNLGLVYWNTGNNELALEHFNHALELRKEIFGDNHTEVAAVYNNIGLVYSADEPIKALDYYSKALAIYEKLYGSNHPSLAISYNNTAIIDRKQKRYAEALNNFQKALTIWQFLYKENHPNEAFVYTNIGQVYEETGDYEKALDYQKLALGIYLKNYGDKHPEVAGIYNQLGNIYANQNKYTLALENYQKALCANHSDFNSAALEDNPTIKKYYNSNILLVSLLSKARTLEARYSGKTLKRQDLVIGLNTLFLCDSLIGHMRQLRTNKNDKIELGNLASGVYEDAIRICMTLADVSVDKNPFREKAFYFAEKSKSAVLLEAISDTEAKHFANIPDTLIEKENNIKADIAFYEQKLAEKSSAEKEKEYQHKLFSLNRNYESFILDLEKKFPDYYNLKYSTRTTSVKDIQKILNKETGLISYFISDNNQRVYVFYLTQKKFKIADVPKDENFNKYLIGLRNSIQFDNKETYSLTAYKLYKQLFPIKSKTKNMVVIPDGRLGTIPFEALLTKKTKGEDYNYKKLPYLINRYSFSYDFSAGLYLQAVQNSSKLNPSKEILLCAPVYFSNIQNHGLNDLPSSADEIKEISSLYKNKNLSSKSYIGKEVQESLIKSGILENYNYLHFATHGVIDENKPELSEIFLAADTTGKEDGNLYSGEIYNLKIKADLVTLSACQTGLGKITKGEGIIGLSRALLYAGAKNLLVSLWSVSDKSTSLLMVDFYKNLLNENTMNQYNTSLRTAKLKMIQDDQYNKPYYWAPFVLIGK